MPKGNTTLKQLRREPNPYKLVGKVLKEDRKKQKAVPTAEQIFDRIELADIAIKKLFLDEQLSDEELDALLHSEYMMVDGRAPRNEGTPMASELYQQSKFGLAVAAPILFTNIELEILAYFGRHPELLFSLPPRKFEEVVATVFRNSGFTVELTPETRDGGIDIIAIQKNGFAGSTLHLVECKRYLPENKVGVGIVQRMLGVVEQHRATQGIIVTTSSFSLDAKVCAQSSQYRLGLNGYTDLSKWLAAFAK
jgi:restriction system protein